MTDGRVIPGPWGQKPAPIESPATAAFGALVERLNQLPHDEKGQPIADSVAVTRWAIAAVRGASDARAKCVDCGAPATRDDGLCSGCRRERGTVS